MKTVVLGDIHGRTIWKDIIEKENPNRVIFLGDYVSTHEGISAEAQLLNLAEILTYKEQNPDKVILLRGNHDTQHLGYYWAECSGFDKTVYDHMSSNKLKDRFESLTQWIYIDEELKTIFSHAGISSVWLQDVEKYMVSECGTQYDGTIDTEVVLNYINTMPLCEMFGFIPNTLYDWSGESTTQPPTWIRPMTLQKCNVLGYDQVVGHTTQNRGVSRIVESTKGKHTIWLCDALGVRSYLTIENGLFTPTKL